MVSRGCPAHPSRFVRQPRGGAARPLFTDAGCSPSSLDPHFAISAEPLDQLQPPHKLSRPGWSCFRCEAPKRAGRGSNIGPEGPRPSSQALVLPSNSTVSISQVIEAGTLPISSFVECKTYLNAVIESDRSWRTDPEKRARAKSRLKADQARATSAALEAIRKKREAEQLAARFINRPGGEAMRLLTEVTLESRLSRMEAERRIILPKSAPNTAAGTGRPRRGSRRASIFGGQAPSPEMLAGMVTGDTSGRGESSCRAGGRGAAAVAAISIAPSDSPHGRHRPARSPSPTPCSGLSAPSRRPSDSGRSNTSSASSTPRHVSCSPVPGRGGSESSSKRERRASARYVPHRQRLQPSISAHLRQLPRSRSLAPSKSNPGSLDLHRRSLAPGPGTGFRQHSCSSGSGAPRARAAALPQVSSAIRQTTLRRGGMMVLPDTNTATGTFDG